MKLYYPKDSKINLTALENETLHFTGFIPETGTIPYKIIESRIGDTYDEILTIIEIQPLKLDKEVFELPRDKEMIKTGD